MTSDQHNIWYQINSLTQPEQDKMTRTLINQQGLRVNTQTAFGVKDEENLWSLRSERTIDSDEDGLPTPPKAPHLPSTSDYTVKSPLPLRSPIKQPEILTQTFVAANDVPKKRATNRGFNFMQPKQEPQDQGRVFLDTPLVDKVTSETENSAAVAGVGMMTTNSCSSCRQRHKRCVHRRSMSSGSGGVSVKSDSEPPQSQAKMPGYRVKKDGTLYKYTPHDRSLGPSMTPQAVDYRERKVIQKEYEERLMELIDSDIRNQVDGEGGITPLGRLFKAGVRMMERVQNERAQSRSLSPSPNAMELEEEVKMLKTRAITAEADLLELKNHLRHLVGSPA